VCRENTEDNRNALNILQRILKEDLELNPRNTYLEEQRFNTAMNLNILKKTKDKSGK
jgi:hypothetical protein